MLWLISTAYKMQRINPDIVLLSEPTYKNFMRFVNTFLVPHMNQKFIEEDYYEQVYNEIWTNRHCLLQMPRGHSKTEMVGIWLTIYIATVQPINPFNPKGNYIKEQMLLAGDGDAKSAWTERIKHFFYENPYLRTLIPAGADSKKKNIYWNERVMYLNNGSMIHLKAITEKGIRGKHVDRLHADDIVTEQSNLVDLKVKMLWDGAVDGTTTNKLAMVQVTGTPLRFSDILFHLKDRNYHFKRMPAIIDFDKRIILSPKRWSFDSLMQTKTRIGSVRFQCEYMLDPIDDSTSLIKGEWVRQCFNSDYDICKSRPSYAKAVYLGVDFAFSDRVTADNSAFVSIAEMNKFDANTKQTRRIYVILDIILRKGMSGLEQFALIKELNEVYRYDMIGLEDNSIKAIDKHISSFNLPIKLFHTGTFDSNNEKDINKKFETVGKRNLILRLGNMFEQKNLIVPTQTGYAVDLAERLFTECISFAQEEDKLIEIGIHPDSPIALAYALEAAGRSRIAFGSLDVTRNK